MTPINYYKDGILSSQGPTPKLRIKINGDEESPNARAFSEENRERMYWWFRSEKD